MTSNPQQWPSQCCAASAHGHLEPLLGSPHHSEEASPPSMGHGELGMLLKSIQTFVSELPKLDMGEAGSRASRFHGWRVQVEQTLNPAGPQILQWWRWCLRHAEAAHKVFLQTSMHQRECVMPSAVLPAPWLQLEAWVRPKLLDALPKELREWVNLRARQ